MTGCSLRPFLAFDMPWIMTVSVCQNSRVTQLRHVNSRVIFRDTQLPPATSGSLPDSPNLLRAERLASLLHEA